MQRGERRRPLARHSYEIGDDAVYGARRIQTRLGATGIGLQHRQNIGDLQAAMVRR